jgi:superfamily II DNA helicase RecQ
MVEMALERREHFVVVLPTGGGKSLSWLIPAKMERDTVTVVVVPYKSLLQQHMQNAQSFGIACCQWTAKGNYTNGSKILFLAAESVGCLTFIKYVITSTWEYTNHTDHRMLCCQIPQLTIWVEDRAHSDG